MNEAVLFKLFEQASTAIVVYQEGTGIRYANPHALTILGISKQKLQSLMLEDFFSPDHNQGLFSQLGSDQRSFVYRNARLYLQGQLPISADLSIQTLSRSGGVGHTFQFNIYPHIAHSHAGQPSADTTDFTQVNTTELLSVIHKQTDMPLHALNSLVNRLLQMQPRSDQLPFLHSMLQSGEQLRYNLDEILLYADLLYRRYNPEPAAPFQPGRFLEELEQEYRQRAEISGNMLVVESMVRETSYTGNQEALRLMLSKLLDNALRFSRSGQVKLQVREESQGAGQALLNFSVEDDGIGMDDEKLKLATHPFVSWKPPWEQENFHSGLGLSIVQMLARICGGNFELYSRPGKTVARITIPCRTDARQLEPDLSREELYHKSLKGLRMLYVEDLMPNHFLMEGLCSIWQISLDTAYNGREALSKFYKNSYDVVLMDLNMPLMNGYDASLQMRQSSDIIRQSVPIIAVTGSASSRKLKNLKEYGIDDVLTKPIKPDLLYQKLTSLPGN